MLNFQERITEKILYLATLQVGVEQEDGVSNFQHQRKTYLKPIETLQIQEKGFFSNQKLCIAKQTTWTKARFGEQTHAFLENRKDSCCTPEQAYKHMEIVEEILNYKIYEDCKKN